MMGAQDFCGHYEWTFEYLRRTYGQPLVETYWREAIGFDSQRHALELLREQGFEGMERYWGHTLTQEEAGYSLTRLPNAFRIDMHRCPSKGYLIERNLEQYADYCAHCMGWIGPVAERAGFTIDHEHNHRGQCRWVLYRAEAPYNATELQAAAGERAIELAPGWTAGEHHCYSAGQAEPSSCPKPS